MYSNNILNFQESTTILNACTKKVWNLNEFTTYLKTVCCCLDHIYIYIYIYIYTKIIVCQVDWGWRIHRLHLCRGVRSPPPTKCSRYDTKQSDGEVPAMLKLWGMQSTHSLPSLPGSHWPGVVAPDRVLCMD